MIHERVSRRQTVFICIRLIVWFGPPMRQKLRLLFQRSSLLRDTFCAGKVTSTPFVSHQMRLENSHRTNPEIGDIELSLRVALERARH